MPWLCKVCSSNNGSEQKICDVCGEGKRPFALSPFGRNMVAIIGVPLSLLLYAGAMSPVAYYGIRVFRVDELLPYCTVIGVMLAMLAMGYLYDLLLCRNDRRFGLWILAFLPGCIAEFALLLTLPGLAWLWSLLCSLCLIGAIVLLLIRWYKNRLQHLLPLGGVALVNALMIGLGLAMWL